MDANWLKPDPDVETTHPLMHTLGKINQAQKTINTLSLSPLKSREINQLSLLPDKDLVDLCPPIEPYQVTKNLISSRELQQEASLPVALPME